MLVAVYGTLRETGWNHNLMVESAIGVKQGSFWTPPGYTMWDLGSYPAVTPGGTDSLFVEVYDVKNLAPIDTLEGYPGFYDRKDMQTPWGLAKYYFMKEEDIPAGVTVVNSGNWIGYTNEKLDRGAV